MVSAKRIGQRRLSDVRLQTRPSAEALSGVASAANPDIVNPNVRAARMVGARTDEETGSGTLAGKPPTQALTRVSPSIPSHVPSSIIMPSNLSNQVRAPTQIPSKVPIKGKRRAATATDSSEIRMLKREEDPAWEWLDDDIWT